MKNRILTATLSAIVATVVFGIAIYLLENSGSYLSLITFFVIYWFAFFLTTKYSGKR